MFPILFIQSFLIACSSSFFSKNIHILQYKPTDLKIMKVGESHVYFYAIFQENRSIKRY